jgi:hypothetical protein
MMKEYNGSNWQSHNALHVFTDAVNAQQPFVLREAGALLGAGFFDILNSLSKALGVARVPVVEVPSEWRGRVGFRSDTLRPNFERNTLPFNKFLDRLEYLSGESDCLSIAMQTAPLSQYLDQQWQDYKWSFWPEVVPRVWIGNRTLTVAHYDDADNIAVVAKGRRRFRLFPPTAAPYLYVAPLEHAPSGAPITMVDPRSPDYDRYPDYERAEALSQEVELGEGDAIFIPALWWHEVESLDSVNVLINYWNGGTIANRYDVHPIEALIVVRAALAGRTQTHRDAWRELFEAWAFKGDPLAHMPAELKGALSDSYDEASVQRLAQVIDRISARINK